MGAGWKSRTVWDPDSTKCEDKRFRPVLTTWLPIIDVLIIAFGVCAVLFGLPVFAETLGAVSVVFGAAVILSASSALFGLVFLKSKVEVVSKIVLMAVFIIYPFFLTIGSLTPGRIAAGVLCLMPLPILFLRLGDLGREKGKEL